ncbi:cytochrome C oxidase subunit I [Streptomyces sp. NPDC096132]|uniref:cytochrome C oxidase subunit I n=1 Tax=Streptomyces sp. NPDC096132 TaxID=3366075 RepID=UPI00381CC776
MSDLSRQGGTEAGLGNEVEGYLLWQATVAVAEERARAFVRPMEWLTTAQRDEIERHYVADSLQRARQDLERIAARCVSLRGEYERRYRTLRLRCTGWALAVCAGLIFVAAVSLTR